MFAKILLAVDGSDHSKKAIPLAAGIAKTMGSEVLVFHVREVEVAHFSGGMEPASEAVDLVEAVVKELTDQGISAKGDARSAPFGRAAPQIVEEAKSSGADVIVMGSRGLSDLPAALVGSVAHKVIHLAHCPVLIAR